MKILGYLLNFKCPFVLGSLKEKHIGNGDLVYVIFTPKENLCQAPEMPKEKSGESSGTQVVRCQIMLKVLCNHSAYD